MSLLIETICIENGVAQRLELHQERMDRSQCELFNHRDKLDLHSSIHIPQEYTTGKVKCRVIYDRTIRSVEFEPYTLKPIGSLQLVTDDLIDYSYKYRDRSQLNSLLRLKGSADDVLIIKNGRITDTSFGNIVFCRQEKWFTPLHPLLAGTRREFYLQNGVIETSEVTLNDLGSFDQARMINAMISLKDSSPIPIDRIYKP